MVKEKKRTIVKINVKDVVQDTAQPRQDWANNEKALLSLTEDIKEKGMFIRHWLLQVLDMVITEAIFTFC